MLWLANHLETPAEKAKRVIHISYIAIVSCMLAHRNLYKYSGTINMQLRIDLFISPRRTSLLIGARMRADLILYRYVSQGVPPAH